MRLFFATWPPRESARALAGWASRLLEKSGGKPVAVENIHLTLAFLGDAEPDGAIAAAARVQGRRHELPIDAARYVKRNQMVWVGATVVPEPLLALASDLQVSLRSAGFALEHRPFAAHVTLIRKARRPASIPPLPRVAWPVDEFLLVRSHTSPNGSRYEPVERLRLG